MNTGDNLFRNINKELTEEDIMMLSPLQLAYLGDAVFELLVRTYLLNKDLSVNQLHRATTQYVKAKGQAHILKSIEPELREEEMAIVRRGRNAKSHTSPKNTDILDYKYATGFEALMGYLYLRQEWDRMNSLFQRILA